MLNYGGFIPPLIFLLMYQELASMGANLIGGLLQSEAQKEANKQNQKNFERQLNFNAEESAKARSAQSISEQLRQMRIGGLNPVGANTSISTGVGQGSSSSLPTINAEDAFGRSVSDTGLLGAQIANINADTRKKESENKGQQFTNDILESDAKWRDAVNENNIRLVQSNAELNFTNAKAVADKLPEEIDVMRAQAKLALEKASSETNLRANLDSLTKLNQKELDVKTQQIKESIAKTFLAYCQGNLAKAQIDEIKKEIENLDIVISNNTIQGGLLGLKFQLQPSENNSLRAQYELDVKNPNLKWINANCGQLLQSIIGGISSVAGSASKAAVAALAL